MSAPAGWYSDPAGSSGERWWNGQEWSATTRPVAPVTSAFTAPTVTAHGAPQGYQPTSTYGYLDARQVAPSVYSGAPARSSGASQVLIWVAVGVGALLVVGILAAIAIPTFLNARTKGAAAAAAALPTVVGQTPPPTFAGKTRISASAGTDVWGSSLEQWQQLYLQRGSQWAWAEAYGPGDQRVLVIGDAPSTKLAAAINLDLGGSGHRLYDAEVKGLESLSAPTAVAVTVPGKLLCGSGIAGTLTLTTCVWTDGKEELVTVRAGEDAAGLGAETASMLPIAPSSVAGP